MDRKGRTTGVLYVQYALTPRILEPARLESIGSLGKFKEKKENRLYL